MAEKTHAHGVSTMATEEIGGVRVEVRVLVEDETLVLTSTQARHLMNLPLDAVKTMTRGSNETVEVLFGIRDDRGEKRALLSVDDLERVQKALESLCPQGGHGRTYGVSSSHHVVAREGSLVGGTSSEYTTD